MYKEFCFGNISALIYEYEQAFVDLREIILSFSQAKFAKILDSKTDDVNNHSIQINMNHIVAVGYRYLSQIRVLLKQKLISPYFQVTFLKSIIEEFDKMLSLTIEAVKNNLCIRDEDVFSARMEICWGLYDIEMML